ncbi:TPR repeat-containing protein [Candidatus Gastranaerophilus sp. (ex Termes propinquus)]|nr:TPR repeat-containing protein [Candidatus Gastranaerophilus sp. (ex Termes propinquus)]
MKTLIILVCSVLLFWIAIIITFAFLVRKNYHVCYFLAKKAYKKESYRKAKGLFEKALSISPTFVDAKFMLASSCFMLREYDLAKKYFEEVLKVKGKRDWASLYNIGYTLAAQKKYQEALTQYGSALAIKKNDPDILSAAGIANFELKNYELAKEQLDKADELAPNRSIVNFYQNRCVDELCPYKDTALRTKILQEYERLSLLANANLPDDFHLIFARCYAKAGRITEAIEFSKKAFKKSSSNPELYTLMGLLEIVTKNFTPAKDHLSTAIMLSPKDPEPYRLLHYVFANCGNHKDAEHAKQKYRELRGAL